MTCVIKILLILLLGLSLGCTQGSQSLQRPESAYCGRAIKYEEAVTLRGQARFQRRRLITTAPGGLGAVDSSLFPIRFAEVQALSDGGGIVQCGETDSNGQFELSLPKGIRPLRVQVRSRSENSQLQASVLDDPFSNTPYVIETTVTPNQVSLASVSLLAPATGTLLGGAFNILDRLLKANEFLREFGLCSGVCSNSISAIPKVQAFWKPGFNPNRYLGKSSPLLSFYLRGLRQIYILGGDLGGVDSVDTDHFDDSVIVHEYAHFLEDIFGSTDSPGGTHQGVEPIDPRLAWSEGWANFFSVAALRSALYQDTQGNSQGSPASPVVLFENIESGTRDTPNSGAANLGEGNFREFAISRTLWDAIDSPGNVNFADTDGDAVVTGSFNEIWQIELGPFSQGFRRFRNFGLFTQLQSQSSSSTNLSSLLSASQQKANLSDYATPDSGDSCSSVPITASRLSGDTGTETTFSRSNQFASNDFYIYEHSGGTLNAVLNTISGPADLDLYIYKDGYTYGNATDMLGKSDVFRCLSGQTTETINTSAAAGTYMINVKVYTALTLPSSCGSGSNDISTTNYVLTVNGNKICP